MDAPTISELRNGLPTVSLLTAAAAIGIGRTKADELARQRQFPVAVTRVGTTHRVPVASLLRFLNASETADPATPAPRWSSPASRPRHPMPSSATEGHVIPVTAGQYLLPSCCHETRKPVPLLGEPASDLHLLGSGGRI
jgi:hypothetical protein